MIDKMIREYKIEDLIYVYPELNSDLLNSLEISTLKPFSL